MTLEIETTRGLAAQILRHRSFTYQEFSQRYADSSMLADEIPLPDLRRQDTKNRQNSIDDIDPFTRQEFQIKMQKHFEAGMKLYKDMLDANIAKECARFVLPLAVPTKLYMSGSCRSWIHYISLRSAKEPRRNTWTSLTLVKISLSSNSLLYQKHWSGLNAYISC